MEHTGGATPDVGLILVHGIGQQEKGASIEKLLKNGLESATGEQLVRDADGKILRLGNRTIHLYEVCWSDVLEAKDVEKAFTWQTPLELSWLPWINHRHGLLAEYGISGFLAAIWTAACLIATPIATCLYGGTRLIWRPRDAAEKQPRKQSWWPSSAEVLAAAHTATYGRTEVDKKLDEYVADLFLYMYSVGGNRQCIANPTLHDAADKILSRLHEQVRKAIETDDCREVQILAHSLGTVIAYHAISGMGVTGGVDMRGRLRRFYTIGSPLEKLALFWPWTLQRGGREHISPDFEWHNFYHVFDGVSSTLTHFNHWTGVRNHRLRGGGGLFRSHLVYERSPEFLGVITEGLFGTAFRPKQNRGREALNALGTIGENLAVPAAVLICILLGLLPAVVIGWWVYLVFSAPDLLVHSERLRSAMHTAAATFVVIIFLSMCIPEVRGGNRRAKEIVKSAVEWADRRAGRRS